MKCQSLFPRKNETISKYYLLKCLPSILIITVFEHLGWTENLVWSDTIFYIIWSGPWLCSDLSVPILWVNTVCNFYSTGQTQQRRHMSQHMTKPTKMAYAPSEDSDQPGHLSSLISLRCLRCPHAESLGPYLPTECRAKTDQTGWSLRWAHMPLCWFCHALARILIYTRILHKEYMSQGTPLSQGTPFLTRLLVCQTAQTICNLQPDQSSKGIPRIQSIFR